MDDVVSLIDSLRLEPLEVNLFRGTSADKAPGRIFGGQVIAQSLLAAYATVENRLCHSLHAYFIRPGDPTVPIIFEVDRSRDGGSFTTRRVIAVQHGQQIFNMAASFMAHEEGLEHQAPMPEAPDPESLRDDHETRRALLDIATDVPEAARRWVLKPRPIETRSADAADLFKVGLKKPPRNQVWMRAREPIDADQAMHQVICAYASDMALLATALLPHGVAWNSPGLQIASLDHAMWFHRPIDFNAWHLYTHDSPSASGGRGFVNGAIFAADGTLVASVAQEGLIRMKKPRGTS